ncbi:MAG: periplasmic heavy metal sensor [Desulfobacterales bacterium]|jgi:hypothetical protein
MKRYQIRNFLVATALLVFTVAGTAWAHGEWGGRGYGGHMKGCGGPMMGSGFGPGLGDLSKEDYAKLEAANAKFYKETLELRREIDDKRFALSQEWHQEKPDPDKVKALQQEISKLRADLDAKTVEHKLAVREMMPNTARGRGHGGGYHRGYCW